MCGSHMDGMVGVFFSTFLSRNLAIILSGKYSNRSGAWGPKSRYDQTLNLAEGCLPPVEVIIGTVKEFSDAFPSNLSREVSLLP